MATEDTLFNAFFLFQKLVEYYVIKLVLFNRYIPISCEGYIAQSLRPWHVYRALHYSLTFLLRIRGP